MVVLGISVTSSALVVVVTKVLEWVNVQDPNLVAVSVVGPPTSL